MAERHPDCTCDAPMPEWLCHSVCAERWYLPPYAPRSASDPRSVVRAPCDVSSPSELALAAHSDNLAGSDGDLLLPALFKWSFAVSTLRGPRAADWSEADTKRLRMLWDEGHSTAEIGRRIGRTKNSVVGRAGRLDLPSRPDPIKRDGISRPRTHRAHRAGAVTLPTFARWCAQCGGILGAEQSRFCSVGCDLLYLAANRPTSRPKAPKPEPKVVEQPVLRSSGQCEWLDGARRPFTRCDSPAAPGRPYCDRHCRVCYINYRAFEAEDVAA